MAENLELKLCSALEPGSIGSKRLTLLRNLPMDPGSRSGWLCYRNAL